MRSFCRNRKLPDSVMDFGIRRRQNGLQIIRYLTLGGKLL